MRKSNKRKSLHTMNDTFLVWSIKIQLFRSFFWCWRSDKRMRTEQTSFILFSSDACKIGKNKFYSHFLPPPPLDWVENVLSLCWCSFWHSFESRRNNRLREQGRKWFEAARSASGTMYEITSRCNTRECKTMLQPPCRRPLTRWTNALLRSTTIHNILSRLHSLSSFPYRRHQVRW